MNFWLFSESCILLIHEIRIAWKSATLQVANYRKLINDRVV